MSFLKRCYRLLSLSFFMQNRRNSTDWTDHFRSVFFVFEKTFYFFKFCAFLSTGKFAKHPQNLPVKTLEPALDRFKPANLRGKMQICRLPYFFESAIF